MPAGHGCPGFHVERSLITVSTGGASPLDAAFRASAATFSLACRASSLAFTSGTGAHARTQSFGGVKLGSSFTVYGGLNSA